MSASNISSQASKYIDNNKMAVCTWLKAAFGLLVRGAVKMLHDLSSSWLRRNRGMLFVHVVRVTKTKKNKHRVWINLSPHTISVCDVWTTYSWICIDWHIDNTLPSVTKGKFSPKVPEDFLCVVFYLKLKCSCRPWLSVFPPLPGKSCKSGRWRSGARSTTQMQRVQIYIRV